MEKIVILSFVFLACVVLKTSAQATTTPMPMQSSMIQGVSSSENKTMPEMSSSVAAGSGNETTASTPVTTPTSGAVNLKTLAGFVASFALIALF